ncbi:MAG: M48 family metallopeptidase [Massilia sp.]
MYSASYFDGVSARLQAVSLELRDGMLALRGIGVDKTYAYTDVHMAEPFPMAPCVLDFSDGGRCELDDTAAKAAVADALGYQASRVVRLQHRWYGALVALLLLVASVGAFVQWGVPALSERIVLALPASVDQRVGDEGMAALRKHMFAKSRFSAQRIAEIQAIFATVRPAHPRIPIRLEVLNMPNGSPNAFALPNGTIVINDQMILLILGDSEEAFDEDMHDAIAGVLSHEIGHVEGRHSMRSIVRSSALALGSAALFGDFSNVVAAAPVLLLNMDFSRSMESAADDYAIERMHEAGLSLLPLADLFDSLEKRNPGASSMPKWMNKNFSYLSSHPASAERSARFRGAQPDED